MPGVTSSCSTVTWSGLSAGFSSREQNKLSTHPIDIGVKKDIDAPHLHALRVRVMLKARLKQKYGARGGSVRFLLYYTEDEHPSIGWLSRSCVEKLAIQLLRECCSHTHQPRGTHFYEGARLIPLSYRITEGKIENTLVGG